MKSFKFFFAITLCVFLIYNQIYCILNHSAKSQLQTDKEKELDSLIDYLTTDNPEDNNTENELFIEKKALMKNRGTGCEAMNNCSGKGACKNGACVCDDGYDYFDCSLNVLSKANNHNFYRKMPTKLQLSWRMY